ncbi:MULTISPECIES: DUF2333 family protein [Marinobacter]|jgi:hypothetical protein|uniref:DUF2333 domain-containing protein n=1 Tax=Marinobacter salarius TaxID=1420917 RepID=A0A1W6K621_9GAMM|nr:MULTISPECIES: DUF2333 family protein [Marinobacter]ARM82820.1 hypothetical protein MARSALSMR5_00722 [Marinobacter salarius]AZR41701.1 hypothetical protein MTMN5_02251 [Marinobacter salarius]KXJ45590.1 MAG: hypothetical protein AXW11_12565 [Marinobacter sp. Hex_13]MAB53112.1 DUF2333 domain-containing protein [Marinobacter sp.]MBE95513.1 DUF2333 domain-containing protein [Marinobacter sp.]|tara:strand:- start:3885 stop:4934 length:1050 start_codon:yes stop_codon:yes gene_type:complete
MPGKIRQYFSDRKDDVQDYTGGGVVGKFILAVVVVYLLVALVLGMIWSSEPDVFSVREHTRAVANEMQREPVAGFATTATMIRVAETLLDKPGGYVSNDIFPPGLWLDNMPNWEYGVLVQLRDLSRAMRKDISRSQSQSAEDPDLTIAEPQFHFDSGSWAIPSTEAEYRRGIQALYSYLDRLSRPDQPNAQFFARADNLANWLADLETRLGSLSRTLGESVGKASVSDAVSNVNPGDPLSEDVMGEEVKTSWTKIDDVFYEARGSAWALLHIFRAIEVDFRKVLNDKNALASAKQIIIELEGAQGEMWSPVILNGSGFGVLANHSLTMAAYLSRASAAISDMRDLLTRG